jgi:hypothetical protein
MAKNLFAIAFFALFFGLQNMNAQSTSGETKPDKPAPEKSFLDKSKETIEKMGLSAEKTPGGGGGSVCKDITKDVKVCVDKMGADPKNGWGGHFTFKW